MVGAPLSSLLRERDEPMTSRELYGAHVAEGREGDRRHGLTRRRRDVRGGTLVAPLITPMLPY